MRILVHIRPSAFLHKGDARGEVLVENEYSDDMVGELRMANDAARAVDEAIDKLRAAQARKENDTFTDSYSTCEG